MKDSTRTPIQSHVVVYQQNGFTTCKTKIDDRDRVEVVNPDGFPIHETLDGLGIGRSPLRDSWGITDIMEIQERHKVVKCLMDSPELCRWLSSVTPTDRRDIPYNHDGFMYTYNPAHEHNAFWKQVHTFLGFSKEYADAEGRIATLRKTLAQSLPLEACERKMADHIAEDVTRITFVEGVAEFEAGTGGDGFYLEPINHSAFGYRKYSFALSCARDIKVSEWFTSKWNPLRWIGVGKLAEKRAEKRKERAMSDAYKPLEMQSAPQVLMGELNAGIQRVLRSINLPDIMEQRVAKVHVRFTYGEKGLCAWIYAIEPIVEVGPARFESSDYGGYSHVNKSKMDEATLEIDRQITKQKAAQYAHLLRARIVEREKEFFDTWRDIRSPNTDQTCRWFALETMYNDIECKQVYKDLKKHRTFFYNHISRLAEVARVVERLQARAEQLDSALCVPEVLSNGHVVEFEKLMPVHLLAHDKPQKLVPIGRLPAINGDLIGLFGSHGGGKTVTTIAVPIATWMAQSGLPVFAELLRANVKEVIGTAFIEKGEGSTCEMLVEKLARIAKRSKTCDGSKMIVILDELGGGTQEDAGFTLGLDMLRTLKSRNVSTLFSSQILSLGMRVQEDLGAKCFSLDHNHSLRPGIRGGGIDDLRKRTGFDQHTVVK